MGRWVLVEAVWLGKNEVMKLSRSWFAKEVRTSKTGIFNKMALFGYRPGGGLGSESTKPWYFRRVTILNLNGLKMKAVSGFLNVNGEEVGAQDFLPHLVAR